MKKSRFILLLGIITTTCLLPVGKADWSALKKSNTLVASSSTAVCYIGSTKFTTLDDALYYAEANNENDKIYVIPGLNAELKIEKSHTINEGDALLLPYDTPITDDDKINSAPGEKDYICNGFIDNFVSNRKTLVTLGAKVELTINGTLSIGAITGSKSWKKPMGQASSSYCEIKMGNGSKLTVNGELDCYGFIKDSDNGNSQITVNGTIKTPVVFYDFNGGTEASALASNDIHVFPFRQYDMPQIRPIMTFNYGSNLIGIGRIWANNDYNTIEASLLGKSNSFINMKESSAIDWQYVDTDSQTSDDFGNHSTNINILKGPLEFGSLSVTFVGFSIDSRAYYLPIPCGYSITVKNGGEFTLPSTIKGVKFMPGSSLKNEYGGTINLNAGVLFYQSATSADGEYSFDYPSEDAAVCLNDGKMNINAGFEGEITTSCDKTNEAALIFGKVYGPISDNFECSSYTAKTTYVYHNYGGASGIIGLNETSDSPSGAYFKQGEEYPSNANNDFWVGVGTKPDISVLVATVKDYTTDEILRTTEKIGSYYGYKSNQQTKRSYLITVNALPKSNGSTDLSYHWSIVSGTQKANGGSKLSETYLSSKAFITSEPDVKVDDVEAIDKTVRKSELTGNGYQTILVHTFAASTSTNNVTVHLYIEFKNSEGNIKYLGKTGGDSSTKISWRNFIFSGVK